MVEDVVMYKINVQYGQGFEKNKNLFVPAEELTNVKLEKFKDRVVSVIGAVLPREETRIMYRDDENDFVTLSTETDLKYALRCADKAANDQELYRLHVRVEQSSTPRQDIKSINTVAVPDVETPKTCKRKFPTLSRPRQWPRPVDSSPKVGDKRHHSQSSLIRGKSSYRSPLERYMDQLEEEILEKETEARHLHDSIERFERSGRADLENRAKRPLCSHCHQNGHNRLNCNYPVCTSF